MSALFFERRGLLSCSRGRGAGSLCLVCIVGDFLSGFAAAGGDRAGACLGVG
jgi:hypothetical protein